MSQSPMTTKKPAINNSKVQPRDADGHKHSSPTAAEESLHPVGEQVEHRDDSPAESAIHGESPAEENQGMEQLSYQEGDRVDSQLEEVSAEEIDAISEAIDLSALEFNLNKAEGGFPQTLLAQLSGAGAVAGGSASTATVAAASTGVAAVGTTAVAVGTAVVAGTVAVASSSDSTPSATVPLADGGSSQAKNEEMTLLNASVDGKGDVITLYFDRPLDEKSLPSVEQFRVLVGNTKQLVNSIEIVDNRISLKLSKSLSSVGDATVGYEDKSPANDSSSVLQSASGLDMKSFDGVKVTARLSLSPSEQESFEQASRIELEGAEISAYDPESNRLFVTSSAGLQVLSVGSDLQMTLLGTVRLGSNDINSVAVKNGIVAVAVAASDKTEPGEVFLLDAAATLTVQEGVIASEGFVTGRVTVGALPDMVVFTPDGRKILVANEGEPNSSGKNPEGSVSIIDLTPILVANPPLNATPPVSTASFSAFNTQAQALKDAGVRLFAGEKGFEAISVAQDLEPEFIAVSQDGKTAFVTLQENNAIGILDLDTGSFTDIVPLGLKSFLNLPFDGSDRDGVGDTTARNLQTGRPVYGQFMPDAIASFTGSDGLQYFVIANEGDDRDDFISPNETVRVSSSSYKLDPIAFPNASDLKSNAQIGRLTVSNAPGNNGDLDGDGDIDKILTYGARSFSIVNESGTVVFDSGSHIEQFVAANGNFNPSIPSIGLFDDTRSDNKGPEPEGITIGEVGGRKLAFVGLERGGGGVMVYDVTDPMKVSFVDYLRNPDDISPEGLTFIAGKDSPTGRDILFVTNEVSSSVTVFENTNYTLQILHFADAEAGLLASQTAPRLAALVDAFEDDVNSITLAGGDNFLPGPFLAAGTDPSLLSVLGIPGSRGNVEVGAVDIAIHNKIGVEASAIGNHEFDLGSSTFASAFRPSSGSPGADFVYLSANLDFSGDSALRSHFVNTASSPGLEEASSLRGKIAPSAVITEGGEKIGLVGATTQLLQAISSPSGTVVQKGPPGSMAGVDDMDLLASQLQPVIDDLTGQGVNKIILMSHLQSLTNERTLATKLRGVDIILAAGSNTRLGDANDTAVAFPGHSANFADTYPVVVKDASRNNTLIVNTDNEFTYLGRLVVDFDQDGRIVLDSLTKNTLLNGAYAATDENVAKAWSVDVNDLQSTAYTAGTRGGDVKALTDAVQAVISVKGGNVFGYSDVYLEGERGAVRNQETNLGNLTADANGHAAELALGGVSSTNYVVSLKNGGGIRTQIGTISPPKSDGTVDKLPPIDNEVSQLDVENSLRFNNKLMAFDTTPEGLKAIIEHGVAVLGTQGRFPQIGGVKFGFDPDLAAGSRVTDLVLVDGNNKVVLYDDGIKLGNAPSSIQVVTLNFLANGGDSYPIKANGENFRYLMSKADGSLTLSAAVDESRNFTDNAVITEFVSGSNVLLGEQAAFERYMETFHANPSSAFNQPETPAALDLRIQNLNEVGMFIA